MPCRLGITTMSLGRAAAGHTLPDKLATAAKHGYEGIELFYEDLAGLALDPAFSAAHDDGPADGQPSHTALLAASAHVRDLCAALGLTIICLQPFMHYEGLIDRAAHAARLAQMRRWFELAHALGTDLIQVPSTFLPASQVSGDMDLIVADLRELADMGAAAAPPLRFVYEALCFATHVDTWEASWEAVRRVDRPNLGLCLDSFHIAGRLFADPAWETGSSVAAGGAAALRASMDRLVAEVDARRVFYVQMVDGERLDAPLAAGGHALHDEALPPRMSWSRNCRLFYGEEDRGAYLPVREIADAVFRRLGFEGWVSLELFNRRMNDGGAHVCEELARRGAVSWAKMVADVGLRTEREPKSAAAAAAPVAASL